MDERFGKYIKGIRRNIGISADAVALKLNMPAMLWLDIENGELKPPRYDKLLKLSDLLHLSKSEQKHMLELAGDEMDIIPEEVKNFVIKNEIAVHALRSYLDNMEVSLSMNML